MKTARRARRVLFGSALLWAAVTMQPALALQGDYFTLPNGQKVRSTDPNGQRGKVNADGSVTYPDGTTVSVGPGDSTLVRQRDGSTSTRPPPDSFELPNGQDVRATDPSGQRGKQNADGSVTYPDGTTVGMGNKGETVITRPDGTVSSRDAPDKGPAGGGSDAVGEGTVTLPNGERVPATGSDGRPGVLQPDGSIRYGDGTVVSGPAGSETTITGPDGSTRGFREAVDGATGGPGVMDLNEMRALSDRILQRTKKKSELQLERDKCLKGDSGDQCRKNLSDAIRQLERENKQDADAYIQGLEAGRRGEGSGPK